MGPDFVDFENGLQVGDIGIEHYGRDGVRGIAYMRFESRDDMLNFDWDAVAESLAIQRGKPTWVMVLNEYMGEREEQRLAARGWRELASWYADPVCMIWKSSQDWKESREYIRDIKRFGGIGVSNG